MPLDSTNAPTQPELAIIETLLRSFASRTFSLGDAAQVLQKSKGSVGDYFSKLLRKKQIYRVATGVYCMVNIGTVEKVNQDHVNRALKEGNAPVAPPAKTSPITTSAEAISWLRRFSIEVKQVGPLFVVDRRHRVTAEQLVTLAERRRTNRQRYPAQPERSLAKVEFKIPAPSDALRMRGR